VCVEAAYGLQGIGHPVKRVLVVGVLLLGAMIWAWHDRAPQPATVEPAPVTLPLPVQEQSYTPPIPADPAPTVYPHWGACSGFVGLQANEDAALKLVLETRNEQGPLFGFREITLEMAECAAYRWRMRDE